MFNGVLKRLMKQNISFVLLINDLHDPFLMKDMDKAIDRMDQALEEVSAFSFTVIMMWMVQPPLRLVYSFIKSFYENVEFYIPDRYKEGYGISFAGIDYAAATRCSLIIALDCGIKSIDKIDYANEKNIDFIICDHHRPGETLPKAIAVLDPKREDCHYPFKELSGCGIGFKLIQAYAQRNDIPFEQLEQYLDLVAISTSADIVPIYGENRTLVHFGLQWLNEHRRPGIKAILGS